MERIPEKTWYISIVKKCNEVLKLYKTTRWKRVREEQLERDHHECQRCKHRGKYSALQGMIKYTPAVLVHHEFRVRRYPQYAYSPIVNGKRNLYSLCQTCHEIEHEEERGMIKEKEDFNEERW